MKTIIDVVNDLRGDLDNYKSPSARRSYGIKFCPFDGPVRFMFDESASLPTLYFTEDDFNRCVAEMSEGLFVPLANDIPWQYEGGEGPTGARLITTIGGDGGKDFTVSKEVEHNGMIYEIGKRYQFSDGGARWVGLKLEAINAENTYKFETDQGHFKLCRADQSEAGTIKLAPVELIDGEIYRFDFKERTGLLGILKSSVKFGSEHRMFCVPHGYAEYNSEHCTNITRLVPEKNQ